MTERRKASPMLDRTRDRNSQGPMIFSGRGVTAVLGPTNTGKTHLALERMAAHSSGVIGLPLRLLAREVYGRLVDRIGAAHVALVTGEEKIVPPKARYSVCTVEAMPRETDAAFVAIDEVQLAGDLERGHIFTDRLLNIRGRDETLLLGSATIAPMLQQLLPGITITTRPRLSHLAYAGSKKITRLPRRTAIVAFSAEEVYAIAELVRRQRGGAAVVMGALSPRTRNAQVELYQSGDVDYLVATDAIGMGLNLDVDHVAFAQIRKFDGHTFRELNPQEMGQIAGRAGRHLRDGTFGVSGQVDPLSDELVERIEGHDFEPLRVLQWRNRRFDFASIDALRASLDLAPTIPGLTRALPATDQVALDFVSRDPDVTALCTRPDRVERLWEVCSLPDYRKIAPAQHADIISAIWFDLVRRGRVDEDYMAEQVRRADRTDGEIDTLSHRIAQIRTWTYVANRPDWLADPVHWREKTRAIEDRLSDALHERLTKRFVDRRTSLLMKRLRENGTMEAEITAAGDVSVEGHHVGKLEGFRFTPDSAAAGEDAKAVRAAAQKALAAEFETRAERFGAAPNGDLAIGADAVLRWLGAPVGMLASTDDWLRPRVILLADEQLTGPAQEKVLARAQRFVSHHVETHLKPLVDLGRADELSGMARGIAFRLIENHGIVQRKDLAEDLKALDQDGRAALRRYGVRFGFYHVFVPALIKPAPAGLLTMLWSLSHDRRDAPGHGDVVQLLASGRTSLVPDASFDPEFYRLAGYRLLGPRAVRVDILERLADLIRPCIFMKPGEAKIADGALGDGRFVVTPGMMSILGATQDDMEAVLKALGYRGEPKPAADVAAALAALRPAATAAPAPAGTGMVEAGGRETATAPAGTEPTVPQESPAGDEAATSGDTTADGAAPAEDGTGEPAAPETAVTEEDAPGTAPAGETPAVVMVWRQGRPEGQRPPRHGRPDNRANPRANASEGGEERRDGRRGGPRQRDDKRGDRDDRGGPPRHGRKGQPDRRDGQPDRREARNPQPPRARPEPRPEKPIDPDSPFAKLQALKDQMKR